MTATVLSKRAKRIEDINKNIERLAQERDQIQNTMTQELVAILIKKNALTHDFETLKGGILNVVDVLNRTDKEAHDQKNKWRESLHKKTKESFEKRK